MVTTTLVEKNIEDGKRLIEALDRTKIKITSAFWFYLTESDTWRLMISSPKVEETGPRQVYEEVQKKLTKISTDLSLDEISVVSPNNDLIKLMKIAIRTDSGISGIRFSRNTIQGIFIEDAYIYRMQ